MHPSTLNVTRSETIFPKTVFDATEREKYDREVLAKGNKATVVEEGSSQASSSNRAKDIPKPSVENNERIQRIQEMHAAERNQLIQDLAQRIQETTEVRQLLNNPARHSSEDELAKVVANLEMYTSEGHPEDEQFVSSVFEEVVHNHLRMRNMEELIAEMCCGGPYCADGKKDMVYELKDVRIGMKVLSSAFTDDSADGNPNHADIGIGETQWRKYVDEFSTRLKENCQSGFEATKPGKLELYRKPIPSELTRDCYIRTPDADVTGSYSVGHPWLKCGENDSRNIQKIYKIWREKNDHIMLKPGDNLPYQYQLVNYTSMSFKNEWEFKNAIGLPDGGPRSQLALE